MNIETTTRRNGNVARLPKALRDKVNSMLDDGFTYKQIIAELEKSKNPKLPHPISEDNLSRWNQGGYQDYLQAQDRRERMTILNDRFLDPTESDPIQLANGVLHGTMLQVCELMDRIAQANADDTDPKNFVTVANTLSRISRSMVIICQYRDELAKLKAADPSSKEAKLKARQEMLDKMDQLFGIRPIKAIDRIFGPIEDGDSSSSSSSTEPDNGRARPPGGPQSNYDTVPSASSSLSSSGGESRREEVPSPEEFPPMQFGVADTRPALGRRVPVSTNGNTNSENSNPQSQIGITNTGNPCESVPVSESPCTQNSETESTKYPEPEPTPIPSPSLLL